MTNPLDERIRAYQTVMDALKAIRRLMKGNPHPLGKTIFLEVSRFEAEELLAKAEAEVNALVIVSLFATFEQALRDHLTARLQPIQTTPSIPAELGASFHRFLAKEADWWKMDEIVDLFSPPVDSARKGDTRNIQRFRNFVAHRTKAADAVPPLTAFTQLSDYLAQAGLI